MKIRKVAVILFYDEQKRVLLQDRKTISKSGEEWGFFGGGIEENETPEQAIVREVKEELDYELRNFKPLGHFKNKIREDLTLDRSAFISCIKDTSSFNQKEGKGMKFFTINEATKLKLVPGDDLVMKKMEETI